MIRHLARTLVVAGAAVAVAAAAPMTAQASVDAAGLAGFANVSKVAVGVTFEGYCTYEYAAAGVGGGGATYVVNGTGAAVGTNVLATKVICSVTKDGYERKVQSAFTTGPAAVAVGSFSSASLSAGRTCVEVQAFLSTGATVSSGKTC